MDAPSGPTGPSAFDARRVYDAETVDRYVSDTSERIASLEAQLSEAVRVTEEATTRADRVQLAEALVGRTLLTIQKTADEMVAAAVAEALAASDAISLAEAEAEASDLLAAARSQADGLIGAARQEADRITAAASSESAQTIADAVRRAAEVSATAGSPVSADVVAEAEANAAAILRAAETRAAEIDATALRRAEERLAEVRVEAQRIIDEARDTVELLLVSVFAKTGDQPNEDTAPAVDQSLSGEEMLSRTSHLRSLEDGSYLEQLGAPPRVHTPAELESGRGEGRRWRFFRRAAAS